MPVAERAVRVVGAGEEVREEVIAVAARGPRAALVALAVVAAALAITASAHAETLTGRARAIDGDTLAIGAERVRLFGIDAPETGKTCQRADGRPWRCGIAAANRLTALTAGRTVTCEGNARDEYGRLLAVCSVGGDELNARLVREGLAWAFVRYSTAYVAVEAEARAAKRGVFAVANTPPWDHRAARWDGARAAAPADRARACPIKGNVSRSGDRIYHLPWQRDYERVAINERRGERWFCDEGEAERAGWRRAGR